MSYLYCNEFWEITSVRSDEVSIKPQGQPQGFETIYIVANLCIYNIMGYTEAQNYFPHLAYIVKEDAIQWWLYVCEQLLQKDSFHYDSQIHSV